MPNGIFTGFRNAPLGRICNPAASSISICNAREIPESLVAVIGYPRRESPADRYREIYIIDLVNQILSAKKETPSADTSALEQQIDLLVYHLYGLTYDEVLIVDPATPITREEYEKGSEN